MLGQAPKFAPAEEPKAKDVESILFDGVPFQKKPTKVFAYYSLPKNVKPGDKVPAMVLVHGGGGTAFDAWVRLWNSRGYAAIAPDLCGCVPIGSYGKWQRHPAGGPPGWGGFNQIDWPAEDQWTWQAVANIMLAHSLLRSRPEIDATRIGLTGISWGGYLTSITSGVDPRLPLRRAGLWLRLLGREFRLGSDVRQNAGRPIGPLAPLVGPVGLSQRLEGAHALGRRHQRLCLPDGLAAEVISPAAGAAHALRACACRTATAGPAKTRPRSTPLPRAC